LNLKRYLLKSSENTKKIVQLVLEDFWIAFPGRRFQVERGRLICWKCFKKYIKVSQIIIALEKFLRVVYQS
jgi:hypothetical protein